MEVRGGRREAGRKGAQGEGEKWMVERKKRKEDMDDGEINESGRRGGRRGKERVYTEKAEGRREGRGGASKSRK